jgi:serine/threonine-protein kinase
MAVVYRARDLRLDRWVALKILSDRLVRNRAFRQRFIRESRAAAAVDHPNILPVFDAGEADGVFYIAMRYLADRDLGSQIDRVGPLPLARAVSITAQVASALDAAHAAGLVHRDVKPANILLGNVTDNDSGDHVYLADFGISMLAGEVPGAGGVPGAGPRADISHRLTVTDERLGTVSYASPEQILGHPLDGRADAYSLACVFFEMVSGKPPFSGEFDESGQLPQFSATPRLTRRRPDLPPAVDQVLAKGLAAEPDDRYGSCRALATALAEACGVASVQLPEVTAGAHPNDRPGRRRLALLAACAAVLAVGGGAWALLGRTASPHPVLAAGKRVQAVSSPSRPAPRAAAAMSQTPEAASRAPSRTAPSRTAASSTPSRTASSNTGPSSAGVSPAPAGAERAADCPAIAIDNISADCYTGSYGTTTVTSTDDPSPAGVDGNQVAELSDGHYLEYPDINFGSGSTHFTARVACGAPLYASGGVEIVLDNPGNKPVAGFSLASTGGWNAWKDVGTTMTEVAGVHTVYIVLSSGGPAPYLSLHYFTFG